MIKIRTPFKISKLIIQENCFFDYDIDIEIEIDNTLHWVKVEPEEYIPYKFDYDRNILYISNKNLPSTHNIYKYSVKNNKAYLVDYY